MLGATLVCKTDRIGLSPLMIGGGPAFLRSDILHEGLAQRCGRDVAQLFAEPVASADGRMIDWYSDTIGEPRPLVNLDRGPRQAAESLLRAQLATLAPTLTDPNFGPLLNTALYIGSPGDIFVVDGRPVICNWGFVPAAIAEHGPGALAGHFVANLGAYASFPPPRLDGDSLIPSPARAPRKPGEASVQKMTNGPFRPSAPGAEIEAPVWRAPLIAVTLAAAILLYLMLPNVLQTWYGSDYSSALQRERELNELLAVKIASIEKSLEDAVCQNGGFAGGPDLPPGDPGQIPVPPADGAPGTANPKNLADRLDEAVVLVLVHKKEGYFNGSGFFIGPRTIVTNYHVVQDALEVQGALEVRVINKYLKKFTPVTVGPHTPGTAKNHQPDFAVISIAPEGPEGPEPMPLSTEVRKGQLDYVVGYPGVTLVEDKGDVPEQSQSAAFVMTLYPHQDPPLIAVNTPISHGNSGGPLSDPCARVLGVASYQTGGTKDVSYDKGYFAFASSALMAFLDENQVKYTKSEGVCNPQTGKVTAGLPASYPLPESPMVARVIR